MNARTARDPELLDHVDALPRVQYAGPVWRIARAGRDPLLGSRASGRWNPGTFDVIYTSLEREGSLAEIYFHLSRQPVFPSKVNFLLHQIAVKTERTLELADLSATASLGVDTARYGELGYDRTQAIGDAAHFLGFDGIIAPSARWSCQNLVLFTDEFAPNDVSVAASEPVDWAAWRKIRR